jgi:hypothetical protein
VRTNVIWRRKEREEWLGVLKRHVRAVMMKKFNFPFEGETATEIGESCTSDLDQGRYLTTTAGERALLFESSGKIRRSKKKSTKAKSGDLSLSSGDVPTVIDKISKREKQEKKEKTKKKNEEREGMPLVREDEEEEKNEAIDAFTIAVLGGGGVGKSSLITRFLVDDFYGEDTADPTLQDEYSGRIVIDNRACASPSVVFVAVVCSLNMLTCALRTKAW